MAEPPWAAAPGGISLAVRLTPRGGRDAMEGAAEHGGRWVLRARVAAAPVDGAANAALVRLVAGAFGVARSAVRIAKGETARIKTLEIAGEPAALAARAREIAGL